MVTSWHPGYWSLWMTGVKWHSSAKLWFAVMKKKTTRVKVIRDLEWEKNISHKNMTLILYEQKTSFLKFLWGFMKCSYITPCSSIVVHIFQEWMFRNMFLFVCCSTKFQSTKPRNFSKVNAKWIMMIPPNFYDKRQTKGIWSIVRNKLF